MLSVFSDALLWTNAWTENSKISGNCSSTKWIANGNNLKIHSQRTFPTKKQCQCSWHPELSFPQETCHAFYHSWCSFQKFFSGIISFLGSDRPEPNKTFKDTGKTLQNSGTLIFLSQFPNPFLIICAIWFS